MEVPTHNQFRNLIGQTFGRLTVAAYAGEQPKKPRGRHHFWLCRCSCPAATEKVICADSLLQGLTKSCGCLLGNSVAASEGIMVCTTCKRPMRFTPKYFYANPAYKQTAENPHGLQKHCKQCYVANRRARAQLYRYECKRLVFEHYANGHVRCACCGESHREFLGIDHVAGGGRKHRKEIGGQLYVWLKNNGFPAGYRVLCHNCNLSLGLYGYCPHQTQPLVPKDVASEHNGRQDD